MQNDSDTLEIALNLNLIRTIPKFEDRPQFICYFYNDKHEAYYVLQCAPFNNFYSISRLNEDLTLELRGNFFEIEEDTLKILMLRYGGGVLTWLQNIKTAYIKVKNENYWKRR